MSLIGKIIWIDPELSKDGVKMSSGYGKVGEFIVVRESPFLVHGVSTRGGYDSHTLASIPVKKFDEYGNLYSVNESRTDNQFVKSFALDLLAFSKNPKKSWIQSVYDGAGSNARMILRAIGEPTNPPEQNVLEIKDERTIKKDPNTLVLLSPEMNALIDKTCSATEIKPIVERAYFEILTLLQKERT